MGGAAQPRPHFVLAPQELLEEVRRELQKVKEEIIEGEWWGRCLGLGDGLGRIFGGRVRGLVLGWDGKRLGSWGGVGNGLRGQSIDPGI